MTNLLHHSLVLFSFNQVSTKGKHKHVYVNVLCVFFYLEAERQEASKEAWVKWATEKEKLQQTRVRKGFTFHVRFNGAFLTEWAVRVYKIKPRKLFPMEKSNKIKRGLILTGGFAIGAVRSETRLGTKRKKYKNAKQTENNIFRLL
uniref:Uncharacterized protein n=1 Tax=Trypanosoma congolense (strain IL3000) TaxID=1068625 RepID=G0ULP0_TRYCI|nr:hypothetical protein, unlikely [Trypanosoma congolense IL3000]